MARSFRELKVWQASIDLTLLVYELSGTFPGHEIYGLTSQMRRAAVSISSNIAEGAGRDTRRDFLHFVLMARGSNAELQTQLVIAARLGYGMETKLSTCESLACEVGRMLNGLSAYLRTKTETSTTNH